MNAALNFVPCNDSTELFLSNVRDYIQIHMQAIYVRGEDTVKDSGIESSFQSSLAEQSVLNRVCLADAALDTGHPTQARKWLEQAYDSANDVFQQPRLNLITFFGNLQGFLIRHQEWGKSVIRFFADMTEIICVQNPDPVRACISRLYRLFLVDHDPGIIAAVGQIILDTLQKSKLADDVATLHSAREVQRMYASAGSHHSALEIAKRSEEFYRFKLQPFDDLTCKSMYGLAFSYFHCGQFEEALKTALSIVQVNQGRLMSMDNFVHTYVVAAYSCLALGNRHGTLIFLSELDSAISDILLVDPELDCEVTCEILQYCRRLIQNIQWSQVNFEDSQNFDKYPRSSCCVQCEFADRFFEKCAARHGWRSFQYNIL